MTNYGPEALSLLDVAELIAKTISDTLDVSPEDRDELADAITSALIARDLLNEHK